MVDVRAASTALRLNERVETIVAPRQNFQNIYDSEVVANVFGGYATLIERISYNINRLATLYISPSNR